MREWFFLIGRRPAILFDSSKMIHLSRRGGFSQFTQILSQNIKLWPRTPMKTCIPDHYWTVLWSSQTFSVSGITTSKTLSWLRVSLIYRSFSGHISGHVPTNTLDISRSVLFGRASKTKRLFNAKQIIYHNLCLNINKTNSMNNITYNIIL